MLDLTMKIKKNGFALIFSIFVTLVVSSVSIFLGKTLLRSIQQEHIISSEIEHNYYLNILDEKVKYFIELRKNNFKNLKRDEVFLFTSKIGYLEFRLNDLSNCFNINTLLNQDLSINSENQIIFKDLLNHSNLDPMLVEIFIDQVLDWLDPDDISRAFGLENDYYTHSTTIGPKYASERPFVHLSELYNLPITKQFNWKQLTSNLCVLPKPYNQKHLLNFNSLTVKNLPLIKAYFPKLSTSEAMYLISTLETEHINNQKDLIETFENLDFESKLFKQNVKETYAFSQDKFYQPSYIQLLIKITNELKENQFSTKYFIEDFKSAKIKRIEQQLLR